MLAGCVERSMDPKARAHTHYRVIDDTGLGLCFCKESRHFVNTWDVLWRSKDQRSVKEVAYEMRQLGSYYGWKRLPWEATDDE